MNSSVSREETSKMRKIKPEKPFCGEKILLESY